MLCVFIVRPGTEWRTECCTTSSDNVSHTVPIDPVLLRCQGKDTVVFAECKQVPVLPAGWPTVVVHGWRASSSSSPDGCFRILVPVFQQLDLAFASLGLTTPAATLLRLCRLPPKLPVVWSQIQLADAVNRLRQRLQRANTAETKPAVVPLSLQDMAHGAVFIHQHAQRGQQLAQWMCALWLLERIGAGLSAVSDDNWARTLAEECRHPFRECMPLEVRRRMVREERDQVDIRLDILDRGRQVKTDHTTLFHVLDSVIRRYTDLTGDFLFAMRRVVKEASPDSEPPTTEAESVRVACAQLRDTVWTWTIEGADPVEELFHRCHTERIALIAESIVEMNLSLYDTWHGDGMHCPLGRYVNHQLCHCLSLDTHRANVS